MSLSKDLAHVKGQLTKLHQPPAAPPSVIPSDASIKSQNTTPHRASVSGSDRLSRLILFGLEEKTSISETKEAVDEVLQFLAGCPVSVNDLVRLGRKPKQSSSDSDAPRPCPVLISLSTVWDRRLVLASRRKLKQFRISRLFIREDLPLEERQKRGMPSQPSALPALSPATPTPASSVNVHASGVVPGEDSTE